MENSTEAEFLDVKVPVHNLESSQTWGFFMDFLNHREGGLALYQVLLLSPLQFTETEQQKLYKVAWVWRNRNLKAKL